MLSFRPKALDNSGIDAVPVPVPLSLILLIRVLLLIFARVLQPRYNLVQILYLLVLVIDHFLELQSFRAQHLDPFVGLHQLLVQLVVLDNRLVMVEFRLL